MRFRKVKKLAKVHTFQTLDELHPVFSLPGCYRLKQGDPCTHAKPGMGKYSPQSLKSS